MVKTYSREAAHIEKLCSGKENAFRYRRGRSRGLKRRIGASGQESLGAMRMQVFAGRIKVAQVRRVLYATRIDPSPLKLFAIEGRPLRGQPQRPPKACALHLFNRPLR